MRLMRRRYRVKLQAVPDPFEIVIAGSERFESGQAPLFEVRQCQDISEHRAERRRMPSVKVGIPLRYFHLLSTSTERPSIFSSKVLKPYVDVI